MCTFLREMNVNVRMFAVNNAVYTELKIATTKKHWGRGLMGVAEILMDP
jgi:uncharacterized membrane protein (UPF0127 family)